MGLRQGIEELVLGKFGLCLKLISEMKVKMLSDCLEILHTLSPNIGDSVCKISKQSDNVFTFISLISFRHKPNFPNTSPCECLLVDLEDVCRKLGFFWPKEVGTVEVE